MLREQGSGWVPGAYSVARVFLHVSMHVYDLTTFPLLGLRLRPKPPVPAWIFASPSHLPEARLKPRLLSSRPETLRGFVVSLI